jgi:hypothetical protein
MSTEAETFDPPPDDLPPAPENGVAAVREPKEDHKPAYTRRAAASGQRQAPRAVTAPPRTFEESNAHEGRVSEKNDWPTKPGPLWLRILDWIPSQKIGEEPATIEDVMVGVERVSGGGQTGTVQLEPFEGIIAAGDESESADAALIRVVTDSYHLPVSDRRSKATFRLTFYWRRGAKGTIKISEAFPLDSPENIRRSRAARGQDARENSPLEPTPTTMANGRPIPQSTDPEILMELGRLREQTRAAGAAPVATTAPPVVVQQAAPVNIESQLEVVRLQAQLQAEKDKAAEKEKAEMRERDLQQQIRDLQAAKAMEAQNARFAALEARLNAPVQKSSQQELIEVLKATGLLVAAADGSLHPAVAGAPAVAPPAAAASAEDLAQRIVSHQDQADKARSTLRKALNFAEPSTEIVKPDEEEKPDEGFFDKMAKKLGDNLDVFGQMGLAAVGPIADAILQPGVAATVKTAASAAQEQLSKKAAGRPAPAGQPGWNSPPKA